MRRRWGRNFAVVEGAFQLASHELMEGAAHQGCPRLPRGQGVFVFAHGQNHVHLAERVLSALQFKVGAVKPTVVKFCDFAKQGCQARNGRGPAGFHVTGQIDQAVACTFRPHVQVRTPEVVDLEALCAIFPCKQLVEGVCVVFALHFVRRLDVTIGVVGQGRPRALNVAQVA